MSSYLPMILWPILWIIFGYLSFILATVIKEGELLAQHLVFINGKGESEIGVASFFIAFGILNIILMPTMYLIAYIQKTHNKLKDGKIEQKVLWRSKSKCAEKALFGKKE